MSEIFKKVSAFLILLIIITGAGLGLDSLREGNSAVLLAGQRSSATEINLNSEIKISFPVKFYRKMIQLITLDWGNTVHNRPVLNEIIQSFKITGPLALTAALAALLMALGSAALSMLLPQYRNIILKFHFTVLSIPVFVIALTVLWIFSLKFQLLPPGGNGLPGWIILPAFSLGIKSGSRLAIAVDKYASHELERGYVISALSFGLSRFEIYGVLVLKNLMLPVLSLWILDFASYLAGTAIIETIFSLPGLGRLVLDALFSYDTNLLSGSLCFTGLIIFLAGLLREKLDRYYASITSTGNAA